MQEFTSDIRYQCPNCQHFNQKSISVPELDFSAEKSSDMSVDDFIEIECDGCDTVYSGTVYVHTTSTHFQIDEPHEFEFDGDMPMYGPDPDEYIPDDLCGIALESLNTLKSMIGQMPAPHGDEQFPNRLLFSGAISTFEAYLSDTVRRAVKKNDRVFTALATNNENLKEIRLTVAQLVIQPELARTTVIRRLSDVLFHNLKVVIVIYQDAFAFDILPDKKQRDEIFQAIAYRHDCVHRNGCDKDGNRLDVFDDEYVAGTIDRICSSLESIEKGVNSVLFDDGCWDLPI